MPRKGIPRTRLSADEYAAVMAARGAGSPPTIDSQVRDDALRERIKGLERQNKDLRGRIREMVAAQERVRDVETAVATSAKFSTLKFDVKVKPGDATGFYVTPTSDWHVGKRVEKREVEGLNEFNPEIATARIRRFFERTLKMAEWEALKGIELHTVVVPAQGDFINGYLHEDDLMSNTMSPIEETVFCFEHLKAGISLLLDNGPWERLRQKREKKGRKDTAPTLIVVWNRGNHGRHTKKMLAGAMAEKTNFESAIITLVAKHFKDDPRVQIVNEPSYSSILDLNGFRMRCHHGDEIRYAGGVGGITVPLLRWIGKKNSIGSEQFAHYDCLGHFHSLERGSKFHVNGSIVGTTPWALGKGLAGPALQGSFIVRDDHRFPICLNTIFVD